jgi:DNA-binding response OmpR family regulator
MEQSMGKRILVVNDTQEILDTFRLILEYEGYQVTLSSYPLQSMFEIKQLNPDLIILDLIFKEEKLGWQMLQLLKMNKETEPIPVIVCTAAEQAVREQEGYLVSKGVQILYKPFDMDELLNMIARALKKAE